MTVPTTRPLLALAALSAAVGVGASASGAGYTAQSASGTNTFAAAPDWVGPTVAVTNPGSPLRGAVTVAMTASDATSGVASVRLQRAATGSATWTDVCTDATSPYGCTWTTTGVADGRYDLRAVGVDNAGNQTISSVVADRLVDNTAPAADMVDPGAAVRGTVALQNASTDLGSGLASVRYERAASGSATWTTICTVTTAPFACSWATAGLANGEYDIRITATDVAGNTASVVVDAIEVDNTAPTVSMTNPGTPLAGSVTLAATAADADSGVASVTIQRKASLSSTWVDVCTTETGSCRFDTTTVADGLYDFRAIATDLAGNTTTSTAVTGRQVSNTTISTVSVEDPGAFLQGTVTIAASANSTLGVQSVRLQRAPTGTTTWTDLCTDTTAPYSCTLNTTAGATPDGGYDFRAIMTTGLGTTVTSATMSNRIVDNTPVRGFDVDAINRAGGTAGRMETGDQLLLTYTDLMAPGTLVPGWDGTGSASMFVRLRDGAAVGGASSADVLQLTANQNGTTATGLGSVNLRTDSIKSGKTATFAATATLSTVTVNGRPATRVMITVGAAAAGGGVRTRATGTAMTWTPSATAKDTLGNATSTAPVTESGALDANF